MEYKDEILEEVWRIKESLAEEAGGDMSKLKEIILRESARVQEIMAAKTAALNEDPAKYNSH